MGTAVRLRCWLLGTDSLATECGEILLRAGHEIHGVVAPPGRVATWAESRSIRVVDPFGDYGAVLARLPFDHLFAITHFALVPDSVLGLPLRSAINFHDGPLPEYAGRNAPVWALINRESGYGVTWHVMTSAVDAGPILKQVHFEISPHETALSLNTKCYGAGLDSFGELVDELASRTAQPRPQGEPRRRPLLLHQRPAAACVISWKRPAQEIEALVRALDFGRYRNAVGLAKIHRAGRVFAVSHAAASAVARTEAGSNGTPPAGGVVVALDAERVLVATGLGTLALTGFTDLTGKVVSPTEVARELDLAPGFALEELSHDDAHRLTELDRRMSRWERAWVHRLSELDPLTLPVAVAATDGVAHARPVAIPVDVPPGLPDRFAGAPLSTLLTAAFCAYLARLSRRTVFDIGYGDRPLRAGTEGLESFTTSRVPLRVEFEPRESLATFVERLTVVLADVRRRGPLLHDAIARHPELSDLRGRSPGHVLPVSVECRARFGDPALLDGAEWTLEISEESGAARCVYDAARIPADLARSLEGGFTAFLAGLFAHPAVPIAEHAVVDARDSELQLTAWNRGARPDRRQACVHELFKEQARRTPDRVALVCDGHSLTYAELDRRSDLLAAELRLLGLKRGQLVGICVERSIEMVVAMLGTLVAGGAYVPLDPTFPPERIAFMVEDARLSAIVTQTALAGSLQACGVRLLLVDATSTSTATTPLPASAEASRPEDLAYVIYTSGSTGRPKGVLVEHRNVASFFAAMDGHVAHEPPGVWLAVTSLSFDISVLELLWTLTRGFKVVLHSGRDRTHTPNDSSPRAIDFSLFFFSSDEGDERGEGYRLLLEGAKFADEHGFRAVWTPERHFHAFGGLYPNPAVTGAALAALTQRVEIRAGSVVLPLHHPIRVAEEWSLVDNLSRGRVGISFASGWHPNDFVLAPQNLRNAKEVMFRDIEIVRRLWRGETVAFLGADGAAVDVRTRPRPVQRELPVWVTSAGNAETFAQAGRIGANLLTHLLGQSIEQLAPKIEEYRTARAEAGFDPATGVVSLMLHTFVGDDEAVVKQRLREPLERYLASSLSLLKDHLWSFPAFRRPQDGAEGGRDSLDDLSVEDRAALLAHARERYYESYGLFGTTDRCRETVERLRGIGVDEIACLIDFGVPVDDVLASLPILDLVRRRAQDRRSAGADAAEIPVSELIRNERVTHLQCTPSMARILCSDPATALALRSVKHLFVGGEALPADFAAELAAASGAVTNLYGPTETTIWSSAHRIGAASWQEHQAGTAPIGRPLGNTRFYVLDLGLQPVPVGVAGELVIGGDGVARGYLRRPELDAQRFAPDPFSGAPGARMYRTGDLVRYRRDGVLEFLGRTDQQIKVRGHRIEPGEIESLLERELSITEAVVVAREDTPGDQRLVAYVVARDGETDPTLLREHLTAQLPAYMVPSQFVFLERIPRTPNLKVDRRALQAPQAPVRKPATLGLPANDIEEQLARLWQSTLGLDRVGVEDNFFDLGGHSVLAIRIHRRLCELTTKHVSLTDIFRFPTIRSLARFLTAEAAQDGLDEAILRGRRRRSSMRQEPQRTGEA
jgi:natural product biosynthesis luciferase-like monooxygenase protein